MLIGFWTLYMSYHVSKRAPVLTILDDEQRHPTTSNPKVTQYHCQNHLELEKRCAKYNITNRRITRRVTKLHNIIPLCLYNQYRLQDPNSTTLRILYIHYILLRHVSTVLYGHHQAVLQTHKKKCVFRKRLPFYKQ